MVNFFKIVGAILAMITVGCSSSNGAVDPQGPTLITCVREGEPVVVDAEAGKVSPVWDSEGHTSPVTVQISESGEYCAFCVDIDNANIVPLAGALGKVDLVATPATRSKSAVPLNDGQTVVWIQYGRDEEGNPLAPANIVRMTDYHGASVSADGVAGDTQLWGLVPSPDEAFLYTINGGEVGIIEKIAVETGQVEQVGTWEVHYPIDIDPEGRLLGGYVNELRIFDPGNDDEQVAFAFPAYDSPDCDVSAPDSESGCFLKVESPRFSPDGSRAVFYSRSSSPLSDDTDGDIFVVELFAGGFLKLTDDDARDRYPVFGAGGQWIYWVREDDLVRARADGTGAMEVVAQGGFNNPLDVAWVE